MNFMAQCSPLNLKPEQSGGQGSIPGRAPPLGASLQGVMDSNSPWPSLQSQRLELKTATSPSRSWDLYEQLLGLNIRKA